MRILVFVILIFSSVRGSSQEPLKIKIAKPDEKCSATLLGKSGGNISKEELKVCHAISIKGPCDYKIVSFIFSCNFSGRLFEISAQDGYLPSQVKNFLLGLSSGDKFFIEKIEVKSNVTGQIFSLPSLKFKVIP